jgi:hypothetical protein
MGGFYAEDLLGAEEIYLENYLNYIQSTRSVYIWI